MVVVGGGGGDGSGGGGSGWVVDDDSGSGVGWFQCSRGRSLSHTDDSPRRYRRRDVPAIAGENVFRGKYGRALFAASENSIPLAADVIRFAALPVRRVGVSGFFNREADKQRTVAISFFLVFISFFFDVGGGWVEKEIFVNRATLCNTKRHYSCNIRA